MSDPTPPSVQIVKWGGSVITRKSEVERPRPKVIHRLAEALAEAPRGGLVLLHGAGSFGHPGALKFGLARAPAQSDGTRARGAAIVATEVRRLHARVMASLLDVGLSPVSVPPFGWAKNRSGSLVQFDPTPIVDALRRGCLPVSFGDVVMDDDWGFSILSADTIAVELAQRLRASRVVFVSDVGGVYRSDASGRRHTISAITAETPAQIAGASPGGADVTGGIRTKIDAMLAIASHGCDAGLISGLSGGALSRALRGEDVYGSWARATSRG